jgi:hypothetical protein
MVLVLKERTKEKPLTLKIISFNAEVNTSGGQPHVFLDNWLQQKTKGSNFRYPIQNKHESKLTGKQQILTSSRNGAGRCISTVMPRSATPLLARVFHGCPRGLFSILDNFIESTGSFSGLCVLDTDEIVGD